MAAPSPALGIISSAFTAATGLNIHHSDPVANEGESALGSLLGLEKRPPVQTPSLLDPVANEGKSAPTSLLGLEKRPPVQTPSLFNWITGGFFAPTTKTRTPEARYGETRTDTVQTPSLFKGIAGGSPERTTQAKYGETQAATAQTKPDVIMLSAKDLFGLTYMMIQPPSGTVLEGGMAAVRVHMLKSNVQVTVQVRSSATVKELREDAAKKVGLLPVQLMLIFNNTRLEDHQEIKYQGITSDCTILGMMFYPRPPASGGGGGGGGDGGDGAIIFKLDPSSLAPRYDYDFTGKADDGATYHRGNYPYYRPYGWKRYALNVLGDADYKDDKWLGTDGIRTEATNGEWPVTYHGTAFDSIWGIVDVGYKKGDGHGHGYGVYSSPSVKVVVEHKYSKIFKYNSKLYRLALQNRVNPDPGHLEIHRKDGIYWLSPKHDPAKGIFDVRPYGILTREV